jgi:hypothetical protein
LIMFNFRLIASPLLVGFILTSGLLAGEIQILQRAPDPFGYPRPFPNQKHVPLNSSLFFLLGLEPASDDDQIEMTSIQVELSCADSEPVKLVEHGKPTLQGIHCLIEVNRRPPASVAVNLELERPLLPNIWYTVVVAAQSRSGQRMADGKQSWKFRTGSWDLPETLDLDFDMRQTPIQWKGGFFTGFCKPSFCTSATNRIPGYDLMSELRKDFPRSWSLQRDFSLMGSEQRESWISPRFPGLVRELETRNIVSMVRTKAGVELTLEDFFGHEQYGIASLRPLHLDYHPKDLVLIADGSNSVQVEVIRVLRSEQGNRQHLLVKTFEDPEEGWRFEDPEQRILESETQVPGNFPLGGCYLRKFRPTGTPKFFWGRLDQEWDIAHHTYGRRIVVNIAEAPMDLAVDGRAWTYPKDYVEYHAMVRQTTTHLIDRYGDQCLDFVWSVFNEPDLASAFWVSGDWAEAQKFYDYTVDGILRGFEDRGLDSSRVMIGGIEIGAIFKTHIDQPILKKMLCHCSPNATCEGALDLNQAYADPRLDGRRSRRVEALCRNHEGQGSPCDFISIHGYNTSEILAAKLRRGKELALEIDSEYYADLWVSSFESCPDWAPPPDSAAQDAYLGNGYFITWCCDVMRRQLESAKRDPRFGFGETILTFWPWPNQNLEGHNNATQVLDVDSDGDGEKDEEHTIALPILNFLGLLSQMGPEYWLVPTQKFENLELGGVAARTEQGWQILVYSHDALDVQSRNQGDIRLNIALEGVPAGPWEVREFRFDRDFNSYFRQAKAFQSSRLKKSEKPASVDQVQEILAELNSGQNDRIIAGLNRLKNLTELPPPLPETVLTVYQSSTEPQIRTAIESLGRKYFDKKRLLSAAEFAEIRQRSRLNATLLPISDADDSSQLRFSTTVAPNGASMIVIQPASPSK